MFRGIFTAVVTPMKADGEIDTGLWEAQLRRQVEAGIHGLIIGGTTGEFYALTHEERTTQFQRAGQVLGGGAPWLAGVNALTTRETIALARAAKAAGASGLLVGSPPYACPTETELAAHCLAIDDAVDMPIVLYNYPGRTGADMGPTFLSALERRANFVAIKESTGSMKRAAAVARDFPHIALCCGSEDLALDFFALGAQMWICAISNFEPGLILDLFRSCVEEGDYRRGRRLSLHLAALSNALEEGGKFIAAVKYGLSRAGICEPHVRGPLLPLDSSEAAALDRILDGLRALPQAAA